MVDQNREHRRIEKSISMLFCLADDYPLKWDMCVIRNIGAGGVKFLAPSDLKLRNKVIRLKIKIPELAPRLLELYALVLESKARRTDIKYAEIRAKFINLTAIDKDDLTIVERMIDKQLTKKVPKEVAG